MTPTRTLLATAFLLTLAACKPDAALKKSEGFGKGTVPTGATTAPGPQPAESAAPTGPTGAITGTVFFSGKAPAPIKIDTSMDPACNLGNNGEPVTEQLVTQDGKLGNVFLYIKQGPPAAFQMPVPSTPAAINQTGCRYVPHVVGVMAGGYVQFLNADPTMHNIHVMPTVVGNQTIDMTEGPRSAPLSKRFDKPELMIPVRCNNHPWMNAFINVAPTPFFAVSDRFGFFEIRGLPPGNYVLGAVHEKLGEKTINVTVQPNQTAKSELSFGMGN